jgi:hypothetical protein
MTSWGRPAVRVLEQKDGNDRPGDESLLVLDRTLHLLALDELRQDEARGLLDLMRPSAITPGAFRDVPCDR